MTSVKDIKNVVSKLKSKELAQFRAWFEEFDAARWDRRLENDVRSGKLDELLDGMAGDGGAVRDCKRLVNKNH
jgi:hypothetical protein